MNALFVRHPILLRVKALTHRVYRVDIVGLGIGSLEKTVNAGGKQVSFVGLAECLTVDDCAAIVFPYDAAKLEDAIARLVRADITFAQDFCFGPALESFADF